VQPCRRLPRRWHHLGIARYHQDAASSRQADTISAAWLCRVCVDAQHPSPVRHLRQPWRQGIAGCSMSHRVITACPDGGEHAVCSLVVAIFRVRLRTQRQLAHWTTPTSNCQARELAPERKPARRRTTMHAQRHSTLA
jgi:hypothetical protein